MLDTKFDPNELHNKVMPNKVKKITVDVPKSLVSLKMMYAECNMSWSLLVK